MDILFGASIIASFFAGMVALFAPCCITVLLPAYLASAFRAKQNILKMTFVFFFGMAVILIPIGLGAAGLARLFQNFHKEMYIFGGVLMLILAVMSVLGKGLSFIPMRQKVSSFSANNAKSVFMLGIFSGAATSCCAPVLAGAMTLAVISASFWKAIIVVFSYVFGMTFPLFLAAYFYDRFKLEKSRLIQGKIFEIKIGKKAIFAHSTNIVAAIIFFAMGIVLLWMAFSGNTFWAPSYQAKIGNFINQWSQKLVAALGNIPDIVWGVVIFAAFIFIVFNVFKPRKS